jgi:hypothetical protein
MSAEGNNMAQFISETFAKPEAANRAIDEMIALGYPRDQISVIMDHDTRERFEHDPLPGERQGVNVAKGAAAGGAIGGTIGAIVAGLGATGTITATIATGGLAAPLFVVGPAAMALAGGGAGAAVGSVVGALAGLGIPADDRERVERDLRAGGIVVGVTTSDGDARAPDVRRTLERSSARMPAGSLAAS